MIVRKQIKSKIMKTKDHIKNLLSMLLILFLPIISFASCSLASDVNICSGSELSVGAVVSIFILDLLYVFIAMMLWAVSPVGILFFIALKLFFSKNPSWIKMKIALILQNLSFLTWFSVMLILFFLFLDSFTYQIFNFGGFILTTAIKSGIGFMVFMLVLIFVEKKNIAKKKVSIEEIKEKKKEQSTGEKKTNETEEKNDSVKKDTKRKTTKTVKTKPKGIKAKVKNKIKEEIKEIIDEKIDRL